MISLEEVPATECHRSLRQLAVLVEHNNFRNPESKATSCLDELVSEGWVYRGPVIPGVLLVIRRHNVGAFIPQKNESPCYVAAVYSLPISIEHQNRVL